MPEIFKNIFFALVGETVVFLITDKLKTYRQKAFALIAGTIIVGLLFLFTTSLSQLISALARLANVTSISQSTSTPVFPATVTPTPQPTTLTHPATITSISTSLSTSITQKGAVMGLIPAGSFIMGIDTGNANIASPVHLVSLDAFYMDKYEVTNVLYKACVNVDGCTMPAEIKSYTHASYFGNTEFNDFPVIYVNWNQAATYCKWRGARLPSEAEWEYAARSSDARTYPWGEGMDKSRANYEGNDTTAVGSYESGKSPFGIYDMAGNVQEWVNDWFDTYQKSSSSNPQGPATGYFRVSRGGAWYFWDGIMDSDYRYTRDPNDQSNTLGFRCALTP